MCELRDVAKTLAYLASLYPNFQMAKGTPAAYHIILEDLDADTLYAAAVQVGGSNTFFPAAAELRKAALDLMARARGELTPEEAWSQVSQAMSRWGWYGEPVPADDGGGWRVPHELNDLTAQAIQAVGGWHNLCASENPGIERAQFLKIYDGLQRAKRGEAMMLPVVREVVNRLADKAGVPRLVAPGER